MLDANLSNPKPSIQIQIKRIHFPATIAIESVTAKQGLIFVEMAVFLGSRGYRVGVSPFFLKVPRSRNCFTQLQFVVAMTSINSVEVIPLAI